MIVGSLSARAATLQDIGGVTTPASNGQPATEPPRTETASAAAGTITTAAGVSYVSPFGRYDYSSRLEILQFRNAETGKVTLQIPSERVVDAYRRGSEISAQPLAAQRAAARASAAAQEQASQAANQDTGARAATGLTGNTQAAAGTGETATSGGGAGTNGSGTNGAGTTSATEAAPPPPPPEVVVINSGTPAAVTTQAPAAAAEAKPVASAAA